MKYEDIEIARERLYKEGYCMHHRATARKYQYDICGAYTIINYSGRYGVGKRLLYSPGIGAKYLSVEYWVKKEI
nr:MAG TPA: hypothetical protein [Caudoviricetes sp.]